ncbi:MAG: hypothetical protein IKE55_07255 [Kiritimatiellae bacterium]|nr:hypothetical protein [Kiritimatiellia bacterium]
MKRSAATLAAAIGWAAAGTSAFAEQPDKWVRYVEATGVQYIDTGIIGRCGTKAESKVEWMELSDAEFLGARGTWTGNDRLYFCHCLNADGNICPGFGARYEAATWNGGNWYPRLVKGRVYTYVSEFSAPDENNISTNKITIDGKEIWTYSAESVNTGLPLYVFADNRGGSPNGYSESRCYGLKIWQTDANGVWQLVRDYQPCMKGGRAGLYDAVSETVSYSASGTDLVCDENSEVPDEWIDYVESQGGRDTKNNNYFRYYVDTGVIGRSGTKAAGEFAFLANEDTSFLDARIDGGNTRFYLVHNYNAKFMYGYNQYVDTKSYATLGKKYYVETELNVGSQTMKVGADGVTNTVYSASDSATADTGLPLYLFCCNYGGRADYPCKGRCYGLKIWQDGVLMRDYRPCLKNGVAGLYDDVSKRIYYSKGIPFAFNNQTEVRESKVTFVDYIASDGNNTLDTGVRAKSGTRAKGDFSWVELLYRDYEKYRYLEEADPVFFRHERTYLAAVDILAAASGTSAQKYFYMIHAANKWLWTGYGKNDSVYPAAEGTDRLEMTAGTKYSFDMTFAKGRQIFEMDGVLMRNTDKDEEWDANDNLHLFSTSYWRYRSAARCYGLKLWQGDATGANMQLKRDFRPCIYNDKAMLYDMVSKCVFRPSPDIPASRVGGAVLAGNERPVAFVEYVESDGSVYVDTGVRGRSGTAADLKVAFLEAVDASFLDSRNNHLDDYSRRFYLWHNYTNGSNEYMSYGYGAFSYFGKINVGTAYHVESSLAVGSQTVSVDGAQCANNTSDKAIDTGLDLYAFACNIDGAPGYAAKSRLYWLKMYQGDADGSDMRLVRDFRPVRLSNGLTVLWDFVEDKAYPAKSVASPSDIVGFSKVGPVTERILTGARLVIR